MTAQNSAGAPHFEGDRESLRKDSLQLPESSDRKPSQTGQKGRIHKLAKKTPEERVRHRQRKETGLREFLSCNRFFPSPNRRERRPGNIPRKIDRKSTRLNSSHLGISYAVFCL